MTLAHLVFALVTTAYILVAIQFEERDLLKIHGQVASLQFKIINYKFKIITS